jgi:hypothetical protein
MSYRQIKDKRERERERGTSCESLRFSPGIFALSALGRP